MKTPRTETILRFLLSKGWSIQKKTVPFYYLAPPKDLVFERKNFAYRVPIDEIAADYPAYAHRIASSIADLYQINKWYLIELLSQTIAEIEEDIQVKLAMVKVRA